MLEKLKAFNVQHNGTPVKVVAVVLGAVVVGGLAVAAYKTMAVPTIDVEMFDVAAELVDSVASSN